MENEKLTTHMEMKGKLNWPTVSQNMLHDVFDFHQKFGFKFPKHPTLMSSKEAAFRLEFLQEELNELKEAHIKGNLHDQFDALIDLVYVALGTAYRMGLPFQAGWNIVHEANMTKVRGPSKRSGEFDIIKPPGFVKPDLTDLLK